MGGAVGVVTILCMIYTYTYKCPHAHIFINRYVEIRTHVYSYTRIFVQTRTYVHTYTCRSSRTNSNGDVANICNLFI